MYTTSQVRNKKATNCVTQKINFQIDNRFGLVYGNFIGGLRKGRVMKTYFLCVLVLASQSGVFAMILEKAHPLEAQNGAFYAIQDGNLAKFIEEIEKPHFDINYEYPEARNWTLVNYLCFTKGGFLEEDYEKALRFVLSRPALEVDVPNEDECPVLHAAVFNKDSAALRLLIEHKEKLHLKVNQWRMVRNCWTPLNLACRLKRFEHIDLLLRDPAINPNISTCESFIPGHPNHEFPLHQVVSGKYEMVHGERKGFEELRIMRALSENGARIDCLTNISWVAGGKVDKCTGTTAMDLAIKRFFDNQITIDRIVSLFALGGQLSRYRAPTNSSDAQLNLLEVPLSSLKLPLKRIDLDSLLPFIPFQSCDQLEESAAVLKASFLAALKGRTLTGDELSCINASTINAQDAVLGMTPLMWAAARGNVKLLRQLLEKQPNFLIADNFGDTALHHAIRNGLEKVASIILTMAPKEILSMKNLNGRTAQDIARLKKSCQNLF